MITMIELVIFLIEVDITETLMIAQDQTVKALLDMIMTSFGLNKDRISLFCNDRDLTMSKESTLAELAIVDGSIITVQVDNKRLKTSEENTFFEAIPESLIIEMNNLDPMDSDIKHLLQREVPEQL